MRFIPQEDIYDFYPNYGVTEMNSWGLKGLGHKDVPYGLNGLFFSQILAEFLAEIRLMQSDFHVLRILLL
jgi:hypothetical protein